MERLGKTEIEEKGENEEGIDRFAPRRACPPQEGLPVRVKLTSVTFSYIIDAYIVIEYLDI